MLLEVISFELRYRLNRPATYIYFAIWLLLAFAAVSWDQLTFGGDVGSIKQNASSVLFNIGSIFSLIPGMFIASAVMGVPVLRDFEHKTDSLMFTTNMSKSSYLFGRFIGSFIILLFISFTFVIGTYAGCHMPWLEKSKYLDAGLYHYVRPWLYVMVPNLFFVSALFFASGALFRKMLFVYLQAIVLLSLYFVIQTLVSDSANLNTAALLDPFSLQTVGVYTRYWTVAQKNNTEVTLEGILLTNRLIWTGAAFLLMAVTYAFFRFQTVPSGIFKSKKKNALKEVAPADRDIPKVQPVFTSGTWIRQVATLTKLYSKEILLSIPFTGMWLFGLILLAFSFIFSTGYLGQSQHAVSSDIASLVASQTSIVVLAISLFYGGELLWKEKEIKFDLIYDALPMRNSVAITSKFLALCYVLLAYIIVLVPCGIIIQLLKGESHVQLMVYAQVLLLRMFIPTIISSAFLFFFQAISSNKFIGYMLGVLLYIYLILSGQMHIYYDLLLPNSGGVQTYSDMNGFAAEIVGYSVLKTFWGGIGLLLLVLAVLMNQRGTDSNYKDRLRLAGSKFNKPIAATLAFAVIIAIAAGSYYYYNANVLNKYVNPQENLDVRANYEKTLRKEWFRKPQPSVTGVKGSVDLYPEKGRLDLDVVMRFKNLMNVPIQTVLIQNPSDRCLHYDVFSLSVPATVQKTYPDFFCSIYQLQKPLLPGDSFTIHLKGKRERKGFIEEDVSYVTNGTFINNTNFLPATGYNTGVELEDKDDRKKRGLKEQEGLAPRTDTVASKYNLFGQIGRIDLELTVSTAADQIALCPGYLQKEWKENGRAYFHYKMDKPIHNFFNIISGRYLVKRDKWKGVSLEVYYHKDHTYNIDEMMQCMKDALGYYSEQFSPFSYHQMRIIEYPKYRSFAQSFSNTVPFSEGIGFIMKKEKDKLDLGYYVTAHELGHQWWAHQVCEADTKGNQMFSESLAQYSAMMLMKKKLSQEEIGRYLKYQLDDYLYGRSVERKKENTLDQTDNQQYIHYNKGSMVYFALQDYIGEDSVNSVLRRLIANYGDKDRYPTTDVLTGYFKQATPDSMKFIIDDLFSKITVFENRVEKPSATKTAAGYTVKIPVTSIKYYADGDGNETRTPIHDYIDIGIFATGKNGKDSLLYLERKKITGEKNVYTVMVKEKPTKAGIDPLYKLVDKDTRDNVETVEGL